MQGPNYIYKCGWSLCINNATLLGGDVQTRNLVKRLFLPKLCVQYKPEGVKGDSMARRNAEYTINGWRVLYAACASAVISQIRQ